MSKNSVADVLNFAIFLISSGTLETLKQVIQKVTKKNTSPLPLWFDDPKNMEIISIKKEALQLLFKLMDTRGLGRIDAYELFAVMSIMVEGNVQQKLQGIGPSSLLIGLDITEIFGGEKASSLNRDEFFYFLDSLFRGLCKVCLRKGETNPSMPNRR